MRLAGACWVVFASFWLAVGCGAEGAPCADDGRDEDCAADNPEVRTHSEALTSGSALGSRAFVITGRARAGAGTITASSPDQAVRCEGSTCLAPLGATVVLEATPAQGVFFSRWRGCGDSTSPTLTLSSIEASATCVAEFAVRVIAAGSYELAPKGVPLDVSARGAVKETTFSSLVPYGADVVVSVPENFVGAWHGCVPEPRTSTTVFLPNVTRETNCHAELTPLIEVSWTVTPPHGGRVLGSPSEACSRARCRVPLYSSVTLEAVATPGYRFVQWSGCSEATAERITLPGGSSGRCTALFERAGTARFRGLGDLPGGAFASYATDVSDDGTVVVGYSQSSNGQEAFRWTPTGGLTGLGGNQSYAEDVSPDGRYVVGSIYDLAFERGTGVIWRPGAPYEILGPSVPMPPPPGLLVAIGRDVRNDGTVYANCIQYGAYGEPIPCRVTEPGIAELLTLDNAVWVILAADDSGNLAGYQVPSRHESQVFGTRAAFDNQVLGALGYPDDAPCLVPHQCQSEARGFSSGGAVIVGTSRIPPPGPMGSPEEPLRDTAWVYTGAEGMLRLPDLAGGDEASGALAVSADGRVIAGFGSDDTGRRALLWVDRVARPLEEVIRAAGGHVPSGWVLRELVAISPDARTLVGNGTNPNGEAEAFRVVLPAAP